MTGVDITLDPVFGRSEWQSITYYLIAWDLPAHPKYREYKGRLFMIVEPAWLPFFADADSDIDWRFTSWGEWKEAHPDTTILAQDTGLGREYSLNPLRGRDEEGPIFPIGDVDPRLPDQAPVVGVITSDGTPIAFPVDRLRIVLEEADFVVFEGVTVTTDAGGFVASLANGTSLAAHQSFWFAWAQFHPDTLIWINVSLNN